MHHALWRRAYPRIPFHIFVFLIGSKQAFFRLFIRTFEKVKTYFPIFGRDSEKREDVTGLNKQIKNGLKRLHFCFIEFAKIILFHSLSYLYLIFFYSLFFILSILTILYIYLYSIILTAYYITIIKKNKTIIIYSILKEKQTKEKL